MQQVFGFRTCQGWRSMVASELQLDGRSCRKLKSGKQRLRQLLENRGCRTAGIRLSCLVELCALRELLTHGRAPNSITDTLLFILSERNHKYMISERKIPSFSDTTFFEYPNAFLVAHQDNPVQVAQHTGNSPSWNHLLLIFFVWDTTFFGFRNYSMKVVPHTDV
jgi:hypothetical protein